MYLAALAAIVCLYALGLIVCASLVGQILSIH